MAERLKMATMLGESWRYVAMAAIGMLVGGSPQFIWGAVRPADLDRKLTAVKAEINETVNIKLEAVRAELASQRLQADRLEEQNLVLIEDVKRILQALPRSQP